MTSFTSLDHIVSALGRPACKGARTAARRVGRARIPAVTNGAHRTLATSASSTASTSGVVTPHHRALSLIYKTKEFLPHLPKTVNVPDQARQREFWDAQLSAAHATLSDLKAPVRVHVFGVDKFSGAEDVITALLEDPLASEPISQKALEKRRSSAEQIIIEYGRENTPVSDTVRLPSAWLREQPTPIRIIELRQPEFSQNVAATLLSSDIPIIVCNPVTTPLTSVIPSFARALHSNPNTILVLTSTAHDTPEIRERIRELLAEVGRTQRGPPPPTARNIIFVDPERAKNAIYALRADSRSPVTVQRYQDDFLGSNVPALSDTIRRLLGPRPGTGDPSSPSSSTIGPLRLDSALTTIQGAFGHSRTIVDGSRREIDAAWRIVDGLRDQVAEASAKVHLEVFGSPEEDRVRVALEAAENHVRKTLDNFKWWHLTYKADEVAYLVSLAVNSGWCKELERDLALHTGRLAALQQSLDRSTIAALNRIPPHSALHSPVLHNKLAQLISSSSHTLTPTSLTTPLNKRKDQLWHPTLNLHKAGVRTILGLGAGTFGGGGFFWIAGWEGMLGTGLLADLISMNANTALGLSVLVSTIGARWAIGNWEKAKRRWWEDWRRVGEGLRRDLTANLDAVMKEAVTAVPDKACAEMEVLIKRRKRVVDEARDEIATLQDELDAIGSPTKV